MQYLLVLMVFCLSLGGCYRLDREFEIVQQRFAGDPPTCLEVCGCQVYGAEVPWTE